MRAYIKTMWLRLRNIFVPTESIAESKKKWLRLAHENARYFIWTEKDDPTEEEFRNAGRDDYGKYVAADTFLQERLSAIGAERVLEIGCGIGRVTEFFGDHFDAVTGVDISGEMIAKAKIRLPDSKFTFLEGDGMTLPVPSASIDFVFSFIVFQHMPSRDVVASNLREAHRVLVPGGLAKIQVRGTPVDKKEWFYGVHFSEKQARQIAQECGFTVLKTEYETERYLWLILQK